MDISNTSQGTIHHFYVVNSTVAICRCKMCQQKNTVYFNAVVSDYNFCFSLSTLYHISKYVFSSIYICVFLQLNYHQHTYLYFNLASIVISKSSLKKQISCQKLIRFSFNVLLILFYISPSNVEMYHRTTPRNVRKLEIGKCSGKLSFCVLSV